MLGPLQIMTGVFFRAGSVSYVLCVLTWEGDGVHVAHVHVAAHGVDPGVVLGRLCADEGPVARD